MARARHQLVGVLSALVTAGAASWAPWGHAALAPAPSLPQSSCHCSPRVLPLFPFSAPNFPALENPLWRSGRGFALPVSGREVLHSTSREGAGVAGTGGEQQRRQLAKTPARSRAAGTRGAFCETLLLVAVSAWRRRPSDPPALPALKLLLVQAEGLLLQSWRGKNQERKRSGAGLVSAALAGSTWLAAGSSERLGEGMELLHARHCPARLCPCSTTPRAAPLCGTTWALLLVPKWLRKAVKAHPRPQKLPSRLEFDTTAAFPHVLQELPVHGWQ